MHCEIFLSNGKLATTHKVTLDSDLRQNYIGSIPPQLASLKQLSYFSLRQNGVSDLGDIPWDLPELGFLDLKLNSLRKIPNWLANCSQLFHLFEKNFPSLFYLQSSSLTK